LSRPAFLVISQVYVPDPASVGQHVADAAEEMARRGHRVVVFTSARGYDDPARTYPSREIRNGVDVRRLPLSSFGKSSLALRLIAQSFFLAQAIVRGAFLRGLGGVLVSTSPPFCGIAGVVLKALRRAPFTYWIMDLNPDQIVATGGLKSGSLPVRVFEALNRLVLKRADEVVVLDRFMAERVAKKAAIPARVEVLPPWPHQDRLDAVARADNPFRSEHAPPGTRVLMYSGNHTPTNPIGTLLDAMERLQDEPRLLLLCVGGGDGKREVEERIRRGARNIRSLPYQPLERIRFSLSAADAHVVSIGDGVVGIVHPCKIYSAMSLGTPVLSLGPSPSHLSQLVQGLGIGWHVAHGDVERAEQVLRRILEMPDGELRAIGARARDAMATLFSRAELLRRFADILERAARRPGSTAA
jgi:glycosyltransferase involved in cell wall biosynthesis